MSCMKTRKPTTHLSRRRFFQFAALGSVGAALMPSWAVRAATETTDEKPATNIADALAYPRTPDSMPGRYPGKVVKVHDERSIIDNQIQESAAYDMIATAMLQLTGAPDLKAAWRTFVSPDDRIGLKVNPIGAKLLSTSLEVIRSVIRQLEEAGIPRDHILIWDRRETQLYECGIDTASFPGITIKGTEYQDEGGSFYDAEGRFLSEQRIDKDWYYWADVEGEYDAYTLPYMVNGGKYSYFSSIVTKDLDKIINLPILKNAGSSVTLCMKNLAYGAITNTGRLHKQLWGETSAQVCAFPPLRDKVVLNIVDGLRGCYDGGPGANPQFFTDYKTILAGTDPVAVDRIGYEMVVAKRIQEGKQEAEKPSSRKFLALAEEYGLGIADINKIDLKSIEQG